MIAAGLPAKRPPHIALVSVLVRGVTGGFVSFGTVAIVLLLALATAMPAAADKMRLGEFIAQTPPQPAPEVAFTDADGNPASLADFKGKPVLVNLWATWCQPCLKEMPSLERLQSQFADRLTILAISEDRGGAKLVNPFVAKLELSKLKIYLDPKSEVGRAFGVRGLPTSIVIDAEGQDVGRVEGGGAEWDSAKTLGVLEPLLKPAAVKPGMVKKASNGSGR
jgi:thiol-disulfide isomerase/thioredoxin